MRHGKKLLSLFLAAVMSLQLAAPVFAENTPAGTGGAPADANQQAINAYSQEEWEAKFPYGTFAFGTSQIVAPENGGEKVIKIYRLGGTVGKAQVTVQAAPVVTQTDDKTMSTAMAAGMYDYVLTVENPLPIAAYQPYGRPDQPLVPETPAKLTVKESTDNTVNEAGETVYGHKVLALDREADAYQWQAANADGMWTDVGTGSTLDVGNDAEEVSDFRCIFTVGGVQYGSDSYRGKAYQVEDENLPPIPEDLNRNPEKSFQLLDMEKANIQEYDIYEFDVIFAEGETEQEIRIQPVDDKEGENTEMLALRLSACKGGSLYDTANTMTFSIEDDEKQEPSFFAVEQEVISADKASGEALVTVKRTGALQYVTTVEYETVDGTAKAGTDYAATKGTLYFPADVAEMTIKVPLISGGKLVSKEDSELNFTVKLSEPKGGGKGSKITKDTAKVELFNTSEAADEKNLATMLHTPEAEDVSGGTQNTDKVIAPSTGGQFTAEADNKGEGSVMLGTEFGSDAELNWGNDQLDPGGKAPGSSTMVNFSGYDWYSNNMVPWTDWEYIMGENPNYTLARKRENLDDRMDWFIRDDRIGNVYRNDYWHDDIRYVGMKVSNVYAFDSGIRNMVVGCNHYDYFDQKFDKIDGLIGYSSDGKSGHRVIIEAGLHNSPDDNVSDDEMIGGRRITDDTGGAHHTTNFDFGSIPRGTKGVFFSFGCDGSVIWNQEAWGGAGGSVAARRVPYRGVLRYQVVTADDQKILNAGRGDIYNHIAPKLYVNSRRGGVNDAGQPYVGTEISFRSPDWSNIYSQMDNRIMGTWSLKNGQAMEWNFCMNKSRGGNPIVLAGEERSNNMHRINLDGDYTLVTFMNRYQDMYLDLSSSVPRDPETGAQDPARFNEALDKFWEHNRDENGKQRGISFKHKVVNYSTPRDTEDYYLEIERNWKQSAFSQYGSFGLKFNGTLENLQAINFNLDHEDQINLNGSQYAGDEWIPLSVDMLTVKNLNFSWYDQDYLDVPSDMTLRVAKVEHYVDMNGNGKLDGTNLGGVFTLDQVDGVQDKQVGTLDPADYSSQTFSPVYNDQGKPVQQFLKVYYNMTPKSIVAPAGASDKEVAQVLPGFVTTATDSATKAAMTREQSGFRFITSGVLTKDLVVRNNAEPPVPVQTIPAGTYTGDGKLMYGGGASALQVVDLPLGGNFQEPIPTYQYIKYTDGVGDPDTLVETKTPPEEFLPLHKELTLEDAFFDRADWKPDYKGNLLYQFHTPAPIFVSDPLYGDHMPAAKEVKDDVYSITDLNEYLGSLNPLDTVSMCVRPQEMTTAEIHKEYDYHEPSLLAKLFGEEVTSGEYVIKVDSVNPLNIRTYPDGNGLRRTEGTDDGSNSGFDTSTAGGSWPEFNMDMGVELPSMILALTDFCTLIVDDKEFGFSIGLPLFSASQSTRSHPHKQHVISDPTSVSGPVSGIVEGASDVWNTISSPKQALKSENWQNAMEARRHAISRGALGAEDYYADTRKPVYKDDLLKSSNKEFKLGFNVTVMFKYSPVDNSYRFNTAMCFLQAGFEYKKEVRLTVLPIIYVYFSLGASVEAAGGVINDREIVESSKNVNDFATADVGEGWTLEKDLGAPDKKSLSGHRGSTLEVDLYSDAFNAYFEGELRVQFLNSNGKWASLGRIRSDGSSPVIVLLDKKADGYTSTPNKVRFIAGGDVTFDRVVPIEKVANETYFSGLSLSPALFIEAGAGIGVEVLKAEVYLKANLGATMSFATRDNDAATKGSNLRDPSSSSLNLLGANTRIVDENEYKVSLMDEAEVKPFSFDGLKFRAGLGVRAVLLVFSFEMDVVQFGIDFDPEKKNEDGYNDKGWKFGFYAFNESEELVTFADGEEAIPGVKVTIPANTFSAQQLFGVEEGKKIMDEIETFAFDPTNLVDKEFQISGYSSSGDAFKLAQNLGTVTDYELLTVGQDNYLLYTIHRENPTDPMHSNMLVLSKVVNTGKQVGLANPADPASEVLYIPVDNDGTGDLDFSARVDGDTIHVTWTSYTEEATIPTAEGTAVVKPGADIPLPSYEENGETVYMNKDNYTDSRFAPVEPDVVEKPTEILGAAPKAPAGEPLTKPVETEFVLTAEQYKKLDAEAQKAFKADPPAAKPEPQDPAPDGSSAGGSEPAPEPTRYFAAKYASYTEAEQAYQTALTAFNADQTARAQYEKDLAAYNKLKADWEAFTKYEQDAEQYEKENATYTPWNTYFTAMANVSESKENKIASSSRSTTLKSASFKNGADKAFSEPLLLNAQDQYKFLPVTSTDGKLNFYAQTLHFTPEERLAANEKAKDYYDVSKGVVHTDANGVTSGKGDPGAGYRLAYERSSNDIYGKCSQLMFSYVKADGTVVDTRFQPVGWDTAGMRLSTADMLMVDDTNFYLAYAATQTETAIAGTSYGDKKVHKLYLQKGAVDPETGAVTLEPAKMLRTLVDTTALGDTSAMANALAGAEASSEDGVYRVGSDGKFTLVEAHNDPYFGKVRFLKGKLGALTGTEENFGESLAVQTLDAANTPFLLFEMNGAAYVITEAGLSSITSQGKGAVIPFFEVNDNTAGRGNMTIGSDGEGNISAVYTSNIPGTTSNAIFVSKYDAETASFGEGRMLAMNHMQVYEDAVAQNWNAEETEAAYLDPAKGGSMDSFTFDQLAVGMGLKQNAETNDPSTLVVLARGVRTELEQREYYNEPGTSLVMPKYDKNGAMMSSTGYYALSFGVGEKNIGEGRLTFDNPLFVTGAQLRPVITFKNTGDVPLRASEAEPIVIQLHITGESADGKTPSTVNGPSLKEWKITESIPVGGVVTTHMDITDRADPLPSNLGGRQLYFTVRETGGVETGVTEPLNYCSLPDPQNNIKGVARLIEDKPELEAEELKFTSLGTEMVGSEEMVKLGVTMNVTNRGSATASAPYLQFQYQTGRTMEEVKPGDTDYQQAIYAPLDLTHSDFSVGSQMQIDPEAGLMGFDAEDLRQGIVRLVGADSADLQAGYQRSISGVILVPKDVYCMATATGSLNVKVTVMDSDSTIQSLSADGALVSTFDSELTGSNNTEFCSVEPTTFFRAPARLTLPLGSTVRLSLPATTTEQNVPVVNVTELNTVDAVPDKPNLGILYYNMGASGTGKDGFLVIAPSQEGSGIIRVADPVTNSSMDIAYTVTEPGEGVNIFKDNGRFQWFDRRGNPYDPAKPTTPELWNFRSGLQEWGPKESSAQPYMADLTRCNTPGCSFTFDTLAEQVDLYFRGRVEVTCENLDQPGNRFVRNLTAQGGSGTDSHATIDLGANPGNQVKTVRVTVKDYTDFDRIVEKFSDNRPILPDTDSKAPQIYFDRSLPATASLNPADYAEQGFPVTVYILDDSELAQNTFKADADVASTGNAVNHRANFRQFDMLVKGNGAITITAADSAGNVSTQKLLVDWFNTTVSKADKPLALDKEWIYTENDEIIDIPEYQDLKKNQNAFISPKTEEGAQTELEYYQVIETTVKTEYKLEERTAEGAEPTYVLVKTVTTVGRDGAVIGTPEVTETDAEKNTKVPEATSVLKIQTTWNKVPPKEDGTYPILANGIYKLTAEKNDKTDGYRQSLEMFEMTRLNTENPTVSMQMLDEIGEDGTRTIIYSAAKGKGNNAGLTELVLNGVVLESRTDHAAEAFTGSFQIRYGGKYQMTVRDQSGQSAVAELDVTIPVSVEGHSAIAVMVVTNNGKNNGSVTINTDKVFGGAYDSVSPEGAYANAYQFALIPASEDFVPGEQAEPNAFDTFADSLEWSDSSKLENVSSGEKVLYIRDKNNTPETSTAEDYAVLKLTVNDGSVHALILPDAEAITVVPTGAKKLETILVPVDESQKEFMTMAEIDKLAADTLPGAIELAKEYKQSTVNKLTAELAAAEKLLSRTPQTDPDYQELLERRDRAKKAVDDALAKPVEQYIPTNVPYIWTTDVTYFEKVAVGKYQIMIRDAEDHSRYYSEFALVKEIPDEPGYEYEEQEKIIKANETQPVVLDNSKICVVVPVGVLKEGMDINELVASIPEGMDITDNSVVVRRTNPDGTSEITPWSINQNGRITYMVTEPGVYSLDTNVRKFNDVGDHWAKDFIEFATARQLFNGVGNDNFAPNEIMSRAMLATVLAHLSCANVEAYTVNHFTDVPDDAWYRNYVNWAAENKIFAGYGNGRFGPDDPITREQAAVVLRNYCERANEPQSVEGALSRYKDRDQISVWAREACAWATETGLMSGSDTGFFNPQGKATRAELATILPHYIELIIKINRGNAVLFPDKALS